MNILYFPLSFIVALLMVPIFRKLAFLLNIVDVPAARKIHSISKPYLGGLALFVSVVLSLFIVGFDNLPTTGYKLFYAALALVVVGIYDDKYDMKSYVKLLFQMLISYYAATVVNGITAIEVYSISIYFTEFQANIATMLWLVGLINAFNLIDGLDGLATGTGIISFTTLLLVSIMNNDTSNLVFIYILIGASMGFLFYNFYPSTIFLGDSGSMLIGFTVGILSLSSYKTVTATSSILLFLVGFLPILDATLSFIRRKVNGQKAFKADALHFHHRLLLRGYSHAGAVMMMYIFMTIYAIGGILISIVSGLLYKSLILALLIILTIFIIEKFYLLSNKYTYVSNFFKKLVRGRHE